MSIHEHRGYYIIRNTRRRQWAVHDWTGSLVCCASTLGEIRQQLDDFIAVESRPLRAFPYGWRWTVPVYGVAVRLRSDDEPTRPAPARRPWQAMFGGLAQAIATDLGEVRS